MQPFAPKQIHNFHLLTKPTGALCNQHCSYCFYHSKESLYPGSRFQMPDDLLQIYLKQLINAHTTKEVAISWQGGEPTLRGLDFFKKAVCYAEEYKKPGQQMTYTLQTNGTLLTEEWCSFFKEHHFLIGLSVDGPEEIHNTYRTDRNGEGSFEKVMAGWDLLQKHGVDVNIMSTVHSANIKKGPEVYRFFRDTLGASFIQFIPIVDAAEIRTASYPQYSATPKEFGIFLSEIFDQWFRRDNGKVYVQAFDVALGNWIGQHTLCAHSPTCGFSLVLEHNGDVYSCDHFVNPNHLLGNIRNALLADLVGSEQQIVFGNQKLDALPKYCKTCDVFSLCYGGCPKDRIAKTPDGSPGLHYLCEGYKAFFRHITPGLKEMAIYC